MYICVYMTSIYIYTYMPVAMILRECGSCMEHNLKIHFKMTLKHDGDMIATCQKKEMLIYIFQPGTQR